MQLGFDNDSDCDSIMPHWSKISLADSTATTNLLLLCSGSTGASWLDTDDASTESGGAWNLLLTLMMNPHPRQVWLPRTVQCQALWFQFLQICRSLCSRQLCTHITHYNNTIKQDFTGSSACHHWREGCAC